MEHILLLIVCCLSVEIIIKSKFLSLLDKMSKTIKQVVHVITSKTISDHWKENILPRYALSVMKYSLQIFVVLLLILSIFVVVDIIFIDFLTFALSLSGVLESLVFSLGYFYFRKTIT